MSGDVSAAQVPLISNMTVVLIGTDTHMDTIKGVSLDDTIKGVSLDTVGLETTIMDTIKCGNAIPSSEHACSGEYRGPHWETPPSATVVGRSRCDSRGGREARSADVSTCRRPRAELANPAGPQAANTEAVALNPSPPVVSVDTILLPPGTRFAEDAYFRLFGPADCILRRSTFLGLPNAPRVAFCQSQFVRHRRKDTGDAFLLLRVRRTAGITTICGLVPWMLMVNKRLQSSHADLPSRIKCLGWPSARETSATRRKWTHPHRR
jgi:hypothetical protein